MYAKDLSEVVSNQERPTVEKRAVVVANVLAKVDVAVDALAIQVAQVGAEDRDIVITLKAEGDVAGGAGKVLKELAG